MAAKATCCGWMFSSIGRKVTMAVTGVLLFGFLIGHLAGNLLIFGGPEWINAYAHHLKANPPVLWSARFGLLVVFGLHIYTAIALSRENSKARPVGYVREDTMVASWASRNMVLTGMVVLAFLLFHLAHYTVHLVDPEYAKLYEEHASPGHPDEHRHDVYRMVIKGFSSPLISGLYIVAQAILALHLTHGLHSMFKSIGLRWTRTAYLGQLFSVLIPAALFAGFVSIPISVLCGLLK